MKLLCTAIGTLIGGGLTGMLYESLNGPATDLPLASKVGIAAAFIFPMFIGASIDCLYWCASEIHALWDRVIEEHAKRARLEEEMRLHDGRLNRLDNPHLYE